MPPRHNHLVIPDHAQVFAIADVCPQNNDVNEGSFLNCHISTRLKGKLVCLNTQVPAGVFFFLFMFLTSCQAGKLYSIKKYYWCAFVLKFEMCLEMMKKNLDHLLKKYPTRMVYDHPVASVRKGDGPQHSKD